MSLSITNNAVAKQIAKRRWVRRLGFFSLPQTGWIERQGQRLYVDLSDWKGPSYHVLNWGVDTYEPTNLRILADFFAVSKSRVLFDIGANVGIFSFLLAQRFKDLKIYAFEPEPGTFGCLQKTFSTGQFPAAHIFQLALSDRAGDAILFSDAANHGGHSLNAKAISEDGSIVGGQTRVEVSTLDLFTRENGITALDAIKLDVQRHEGKVLAGATESIRRFRPLVLMECYFADIATSESDLLKPFASQDYRVINPRTRTVHDIDPSTLCALKTGDEHYCDLVFIPREKVANSGLLRA